MLGVRPVSRLVQRTRVSWLSTASPKSTTAPDPSVHLGSSTDTDVLIIGGGHNGLVCARFSLSLSPPPPPTAFSSPSSSAPSIFLCPSISLGLSFLFSPPSLSPIFASYLAKKGLKVTVVERRHLVGGAAVTEEMVPGFKFSR